MSGEGAESFYMSLREALEERNGVWFAHHVGYEISSVFQPIFSFPHRRPVGYEALARVRDEAGDAVAPLDFFARFSEFGEQLHLDRLCRLLHVYNFIRQAPGDCWLFLNIHPSVLVHGAHDEHALLATVRALDAAGLPMHRVVFEVTEEVLAQDAKFEAAVDIVRQTGCLLALDDFGAGHSNFDRVWRVHPEIVKLDRSLIRRAVGSRRIARVMTQMVALLHECGALVLLEGVETEDEALLALDADVDLVQGFAFGHPEASLPAGFAVSDAIELAWAQLDQRHAQGRQVHSHRIAPYQSALKKALPALRQSQNLRSSCQALLALPDVQQIYLLDEHGREIGRPVQPAQQRLEVPDRRFEPLDRAGDARWARRPYFRRAVAELGQVQMTRPYLSLNGARMCVTVSLAFWCHAKMQVLCADLDWVSPEE